jgi:hypothetical protein
MTSPIRNIEQLVGRVVRKDKNKKTPIVIDMVDYTCPEIARSFYGRRRFYMEREWPIQYYLSNNGKLMPVDEDVALDIVAGK